MARRGPLSASHKAAISAGLKRYHAARRAGSGGSSKVGGPKNTINIDTGKTISREAAARIMFGSRGSAKKAARGRKVKKGRK